MGYKFKKLKRFLSTLLMCTMVFEVFPDTLYTAVYAKSAENDGIAVTGDETVSSASLMYDETVTGVSLMSDDENAKKATEIVSKMTLEQKIAQMLMPSFRYWKTGDKIGGVPELNDAIRNCIKEHGFGGIIVFAENIQGTEQTVRLIDDMQKASVSGGNLPLLIAADQEGGRVARLATGTSMSGNMSLGALNDKNTTKEYAKIIGSELKAVGINVDFAPVIDVNNNPSNPVINIRSFSSDANIVADMGEAFIEGLHEENIITSLKHFPGHGDTGTDSHTGLPCIDKSYDEIKKTELVPFARGIEENSEMIMTAHIQFPQIEKETYTSQKTGEAINLPATLSKTMITDVLRGDMGYKGVVVTDSLDMAAIKEHFTLEDTAKLAINADVDLLLIPFYAMDADEMAKFDEYINSIADMVRNNEIDEDTITRSAERIVLLKLKSGLSEYNADVEQKVKEAKNILGCKAHHDKELEIGAKAVTLLKNEKNAFPAELGENEKAVVFCDSEEYFNGVKYGEQILKENSIIPENADIEVYSLKDAVFDDFKDKVKGAKYVIIDSVMSSLSNIDTSSNKVKFINEALSYAKNNNIHSAVMSMYMPYDVARYQNADALFAVYSSKSMTEIHKELDGETKTYGPGYTAALCAAFGYIEPQGKLPVDIYQLDNNQYSDKILYNIGYGLSYEKNQEDEDRVVLGDERFEEYLPLLQGKRVALFSNHTGIVGNKTNISNEADSEGSDLIQLGFDKNGNELINGQHILDALIEKGVNVTAIFSPEHGFRGTADAGESVDDSVDEKTGVPILSLYHNDTHYPSRESMNSFDTLVVDMQDVGLRYYTYYISMYYLMDACASSGKEVIILDRPNPNGFYVDGPILKDEYRSNVGRLPIPIVHGMTWGELAQMINGEGWLERGKDTCKLTVIPCKNYTHDIKTKLIRKPSPNIKDMRAVYLYASTCFFENTYASVGRGTEMPFEVYGSPYLNEDEYTFSFTPQSMEGAMHPPFEGEKCNGRDLRVIPLEEIWENGINLDYLIDAYSGFTKEHPDMDFFANPMSQGRYWIDLLSGSDELRKQIVAGKSAGEIKASWQADINSFLKQRKPYLLYSSEGCGDGHGHDYTGKITKQPTVTSDGIMTYTCSRCGETYTEIIPKIPVEETTKETASETTTFSVRHSGGSNGRVIYKTDEKPDTTTTEAENTASDNTGKTDNTSNTATDSYKGFDDVKGLWCENAVNELYDKGIIKGRTEVLFAPYDNLTRAEVVLLLANMKGVDLSSYENKTSKFTDADKNAWYYAALVWAEENNIVYGVGNDKFAPEKNITREETATLVYRYIGISADTSHKTFIDFANISEYAKEAVATLFTKDIIKGYPDYTFKPKNTITRAETASILYNIAA